MILLDELDVKEKDLLSRRESLPPYSPRRSLRLPVNAEPRGATRVPSTPPAPSATLHPRTASLATSTYAHSESSLTLDSGHSSQTLLVPPLPTPPPSASLSGPSVSQLSATLSSFLSSPPKPLLPPSYLRASNHVYIQRDVAAITGSFLIDPALQVPDCLLPDDPDVLLVREDGGFSGKGKQKQANICLITHSGDVAVDIWIREGCALLDRNRTRRQGGGSSISGNVFGDIGNSAGLRSGRTSLDSSDDSLHYWRTDWTSPPSSMPWPDKTKEVVDIEIRSETGSIAVRIHGQSHQRLRIRVSSAQGSIAVGVPRTFAGYVESSTHARRSDSISSLASLQRLRSASTLYIPGLLNEKAKDKEESSITDDLVGTIVQEFSQTLPMAMRQPVHFSSEMESRVFAFRGSEKGRYLVGFDKPILEHMNTRYLDELRYSGNMTVFYNDEYSQNRSDSIITKLINKATR